MKQLKICYKVRKFTEPEVKLRKRKTKSGGDSPIAPTGRIVVYCGTGGAPTVDEMDAVLKLTRSVSEKLEHFENVYLI